MSRLTENRAKDYLFNQFRSRNFKFTDITRETDSGFDLWLEYNDTKEKRDFFAIFRFRGYFEVSIHS